MVRNIEQIFGLVHQFFEEADIPITEVQSWGHLVIIILENDTGDLMTKVPRSVAGCNCFYLFEDMMDRPANLSAERIREPASTQPDDSAYEIIRPGVMLSSVPHPEQGWRLQTSAGVLIKDHLGYEYMTAAAHGFPGLLMSPYVYCANSSTIIGEMIIEINSTDIALVKLKPGVQFQNEPFENTVVPGALFKLEGLSTTETTIGDSIFMDTSFTGYVEGTRGAQSKFRVPSDSNNPKQIWIQCAWDYIGQNSSTILPDGICGSAIWDNSHDVVGFFGMLLNREPLSIGQ
ncbi:hypothetical protein N7495_009723 [Penicillium taxi]|uniref:uncharacterized protein n=1 Tax=Penicillium taxi TaxID=168475 RepID=UPI00254504FE|nr:uncharacterized protein N7495_009723 [Penicillium taxi]KAJ5885213.1 hypothetical protein N7495_009723 [Penicillium taxi]